MKYLRYYLIVIFALLTCTIYSQETGQWFSAEVEIDLPKKFTFETSLEARTLNSFSVPFYKYFTQLGIGYKISKNFDVAIKYRFSWRVEDNLHYYLRNKFMVDLKFDQPIERFKFNYRARFHRITRTYIDSKYDLVPIMHFRNKFEVSYNVPKNPIEPAIFCELFIPLNPNLQGPIDEIRFGGDVKYPINKKHMISGGIMYLHYQQYQYRISGIVFQLGYKYTFKV